jgi:hypothetical protein
MVISEFNLNGIVSVKVIRLHVSFSEGKKTHKRSDASVTINGDMRRAEKVITLENDRRSFTSIHNQLISQSALSHPILLIRIEKLDSENLTMTIVGIKVNGPEPVLGIETHTLPKVAMKSRYSLIVSEVEGAESISWHNNCYIQILYQLYKEKS